MARNRQRAKQRQAERRARRLSQGDQPADPEAQATDGAPTDGADGDEAGARAREAVGDPRTAEPGPAVDPDLSVGAPPEEEGRSDSVLEDEPELDEDEHLSQEEIAEEAEAEEEEGYAPRGRRGTAEAEPAKGRSRVVQFLFACWAELQRVQWPNRQALTTLTGVVLGFVVIAGGYLGLMDAIVSRIIQAIL